MKKESMSVKQILIGGILVGIGYGIVNIMPDYFNKTLITTIFVIALIIIIILDIKYVEE